MIERKTKESSDAICKYALLMQEFNQNNGIHCSILSNIKQQQYRVKIYSHNTNARKIAKNHRFPESASFDDHNIIITCFFKDKKQNSKIQY